MRELNDLHAFVDGELLSDETRDVRVWVASDQTAQAELSAISNLKDCLKDKSARHSADECWKDCLARLNEIDRARRVEGFVGKYAWAMCTILFALVIAGRYAGSDLKGETVRAADLSMIQPFHSQAQMISPSTQKLYKELLSLSHRNRSGLTILNRSVVMLKDSPVDRLQIADRQGVLTYFVIHDQVKFEGSAAISPGSDVSGGLIPGSSPNLNYVIWVDDTGFTNVLMGPRPVDELGRAAVKLGLRTSAN